MVASAQHCALEKHQLMLLTWAIPKPQFLFQPQLHLLATAQKPAAGNKTFKQGMSLLPFAHNEYSVHLRSAMAQSPHRARSLNRIRVIGIAASMRHTG